MYKLPHCFSAAAFCAIREYPRREQAMLARCVDGDIR